MDSSLAVSLVSVAVTVVIGLAAICIAWRLSQKAEESLRKSTKVAALTTGQVLRSVHYSQQPDYDEIIEAGWPYWDVVQSANIIEPGATIALVAQQVASGSGPLYSPEDKIIDPRWVVVSPSGRSFHTTVKREFLDDHHCRWGVAYPNDFPDATSDEEGLYTVDCFIPERVYGRLFSSFFVLG